jgi:hypothetical protein
LPPSLCLVAISFFFERASLFGSHDNGAITVRFQQLSGVLLGFDSLHCEPHCTYWSKAWAGFVTIVFESMHEIS